MRPAPPIEIRIVRFGVWRAAVSALAAVSCAVMAVWWLQHPAPVPAAISALCAAGVALALAAVSAGWRQPPVALRCVAGRWQLQRRAAGPWTPGRLAIALDLGSFLLLRFMPDAAGSGRRWIAVQRGGLERQWHELRCAVHAPRPDERGDAEAVGTPHHG